MINPNQHPEDQQPLRKRPLPEVAATLQDVLGQRLVAYAIRERSPKQIGLFATGNALPTIEVEFELRNLAEVTETLLAREGESAETVRALMIGANPDLNDRAAVELFHNGESERVVSFARSYQ